jgi:type 1 glutamine amidotransferase
MTIKKHVWLFFVAAMIAAPLMLVQQTSAQQAAAQGVCAAPAGRSGAAGRGANAPARKRVLAWADSRNGIAQHEYVSYALAQLQRIGHDSKAYDVVIRTDSDIISFNPKMTDGKTPASGGPSLCNIDAIVFAGHRRLMLDEQQKKDLIAAIHDKGVGFVSLFIGMLPNDDFPEMANILGVKAASVDVHDPFPVSPIINESPDSPFTKHLSQVWNLPGGSGYQPDFYSRSDIQVLLRKDLSKLSPVAKYTRTDGDYPMAWTKMYGKGHVFVSSIGNSATLWDNSDLLKMYDEAIKWSLGLTQYDVMPHQLPAGVRGPSGPPAAAAPARGGRGPTGQQ